MIGCALRTVHAVGHNLHKGTTLVTFSECGHGVSFGGIRPVTPGAKLPCQTWPCYKPQKELGR